MKYRITKYDADTLEFRYLQKQLKKIGVDLSCEALFDGSDGLVLDFDSAVFTKSTNRYAGRPRIEVYASNTVSYTLDEIAEMIDKKGAEQVANEHGISRRTLFRRIKDAKDHHLGDVELPSKNEYGEK